MTAPVRYLLSIVTVCQAAGGTLAGQAPQEAQRRLSAGLTGCDSSLTVPSDSVYEADAVDQPVRASRLNIQWMPVRVGHVLRTYDSPVHRGAVGKDQPLQHRPPGRGGVRVD